jgi:hypothetical protein
MASPFPLENANHFHDVLLVGSAPYFNIRHSAAPHNLQYSAFHVPLSLKPEGVKLMAFILIR